MIFSSIEFILVFLPIVGVLYALARRVAGVGAALGVLTLASLTFYGISSVALVARKGDASPGAEDLLKAILSSHLMLLLGSVVLNWLLAFYIVPGTHRGRVAMGIGIVFNVSLIFWFKYAFFASTVAHDAGLVHFTLGRKVLPLGISFFTFVQIAYLVDRYKGRAPAARFGRYLLFVSFFPHLIAGPIVHHASMMPQLEHPKPTWDTFALGLFVFAVGFSKKTLLADPLGMLADAGFHNAHALATVNAWAVVLAYTFQLYFDFSGYSDMAIGLALLFGVQFPWNFLSPYKTTNIATFWRAWHITLSNFLRDYVYIPLGGSRCSKWRSNLNLLVTMLLGGIWHGAGWTFILWGALHGIGLVINHRWQELKIATPKILGWALTMATVIAGWVLFRAASFSDAAGIYKSMLGLGPARWVRDPMLVTALPYLLLATLAALVFPNTRQLSEKFKPSLFWAFGTGALMCMAMMFVLGKVSAPEFLYYDF